MPFIRWFAQEPIPVIPFSKQHDSLSEEDQQRYESLAKSLGIAHAKLKIKPLMQWIDEHGLMVYRVDDVRKYLDRMLGQRRWVWRPTDVVSSQHISSGGWNSTWGLFNREYLYNWNGQTPIPLPVLETMNSLKTEYPQAAFFITDPMTTDEVKRQIYIEEDPFLGVTIDGGPLYIIERWDEPAFRGEGVYAPQR